MSSKSAAAILQRQFKDITDPKKGIPSFHIELDDDNIFYWKVGIMVLNKESLYHGGYFKCRMRFPADYPFSPPGFSFTPSIFHPNVYKDGRLCISILHEGGDPTSGLPDSETWSPAQTAESVLISIVSLLEDPNLNSPANVDACWLFKNNYEAYKEKVLEGVERSKNDIPKGFVIPDSESDAFGGSAAANKELEQEHYDEEFWYDSEEESFDEESLMDDINDEEDDVEEEEESEVELAK